MTRYLFILTILFTLSCGKSEDIVTPDSDPPLSNTPKIELKSVTPTTVTQFEDAIVFTVFFQDGDGDIGFSDPDSLSFYLTDTRKDLTEKFHIAPQAASDSTEVALQGYLVITLDHTFLLDTAGTSSETTTYKIKIKDRSGNWSNEETSSTITINP